MAVLTDSAELHVSIDYRLVGLVDDACHGGAKPPSPQTVGHWIGTTPGNVYLENIDEEVVLGAQMRLETWDGPAKFDPSGWDRSDVIVMDFPSGILGVDELTYGGLADVYRLPEGRRWNTRLAWRVEAPAKPGERPFASILVQFWPAEHA
ncbi:hypothetical protein [Micromonospora sp. NPDC051006]|uniref:hypothetical protein n=1 Tax=Micromonospora sp. NPDC051006 TaxID=3364283 RepID=UPI003789740E